MTVRSYGTSGPPTHWQVCSRCGGRGGEFTADPAAMRAARESAGLSLRDMGARLGFSAMYLCDVEKGRRRATERIVEGYAALLPGVSG